ncbi:isochorismatase family protein [uncultured Pigmentiphaga sp.]|jgi:Amidases related to nicotinamidase|uniref:isochorismatase family protein n=1 Tax=uncultured Pigmentiphaga sp. TaxID=340361 RepID=UPI002624C835|nr:isochorismatase family protein [uncultured Pigmentiphaga sp.]
MSYPWNGLLSESDLEIYKVVGFGKPMGLGKRPALLVIDVQYRTSGSSSVPILDAMKEYRTACGEYAWSAIPRIAELIRAFRAKSLPVIYPIVAKKTSYDSGGLAAKMPAVLEVDDKGYEIVREIAPEPGELLLPKVHASAFAGTPLASYLVHLGVDSLVVTGCSTSGCVRATVVDASFLNYRVAVPYDAVYDRIQASHAINLFDMASKYADVCPAQDVIVGLETAN